MGELVTTFSPIMERNRTLRRATGTKTSGDFLFFFTFSRSLFLWDAVFFHAMPSCIFSNSSGSQNTQRDGVACILQCLFATRLLILPLFQTRPQKKKKKRYLHSGNKRRRRAVHLCETSSSSAAAEAEHDYSYTPWG